MGFFPLSILLPPLLVFGLYHLLTWTDLFHINRLVLWKRVALASGVTHLALAAGFFIYLYMDYRSGSAPDFEIFLYERSEFRWILTVFDTAAMAALLLFFMTLDGLGLSSPGLVTWTIAITAVVGTLQWALIGGAAGALLERFWAGLKTGDDDEEWFQ